MHINFANLDCMPECMPTWKNELVCFELDFGIFLSDIFLNSLKEVILERNQIILEHFCII